MDLSIVIPLKDERDNLTRLHESITQALSLLPLPRRAEEGWGEGVPNHPLSPAAEETGWGEGAGLPSPPPRGRGVGGEGVPLSYEIILVDDGSSDGSFAVLEELARRDARVKVICLKRNFGQSAALQAGLDAAQGDVIATMDGDLQNDPADLPMLLHKLEEGYDGVFGIRAKRQDSLFIRKVPSLMANWLIRKVTGSSMRDLGCTLRVMRRDVAKSLTLYGEMHRFIPILAEQAGAKLIQVPVRHHPRTAGKTKYTLSRTFRVLLDLITVKFLHSYVTRPMHMMGLAGLASMALGFLSLLATVAMKVFEDVDMTGNPLLLLSTLMVVLGVQFISMGLIGELMSRTYFESQGKRAYTVGVTLNMEAKETKRAA